MRTAFLAFALGALAGCVNARAPTPAEVVVLLGGAGCLPIDAPVIGVELRNASNQRVSFPTYGASGRTYELYAGAYELLDGKTGRAWAPVLDEFVPSTHQIVLSPGDRAAVQFRPSVWPSAADAGTFVVEIRDTRWLAHRSKELGVCHTGASPNNSSKPTSLRGAA